MEDTTLPYTTQSLPDKKDYVKFFLALAAVAIIFYMLGSAFRVDPVDKGEPLPAQPTRIVICEDNGKSAFGPRC